MYTLEKHLTQIANDNPQYNILLSIWSLNKSSIPLAQSNIIFNFPHYSLHEKSHSETIIKNIESFLGENRIKTLSPTDTWLILMAAHTHDLGMVVFHKAIEEKWIEEEFQDYLESTAKSSREIDLTKAANLLLEVQNDVSDNKSENKKLIRPLEIRKATILIVSDYFRRIHHQRSREMIVGADREFNRLMSNFNMDQIPNRFSNILGEIAFAHGIDFYGVVDKLEYESNGYASDKMHPRFIAFLLRLGDLLDVDDKRFNPFTEKVFSDLLPKISLLHKEKHASTKHFLVRPDKIEITIDCNSDEVYRVAREWFDWLQKEVEDQSREWSNIAPENLTGLPPSISRGKLKVLYDNTLPKQELMNLRFAISNEKIFEMLEGAAIYEDPGFVFLREIVQNAIDATKIQIWKDILNGNYNVLLRQHLNINEAIDTDLIIEKIKYPDDIPDVIYGNYQISLNIYWNEANSDNLLFDIIDKGTGISEANIIRMTSRVGESRSKDKSFVNFRKKMPYWLKPTGAFGIGMQSIFIIAKEFLVHTKSENESAKELRFVSSKNGEYSRVTSNTPHMSRGTRVIIGIDKGSFEDVFGRSFNYSILEDWDYFTENLGSEYLLKIMSYIKESFRDVKLLNIRILNDYVLMRSHYGFVQTESLLEVVDKRENEHFRISLIHDKPSNDFHFIIDERIEKSGSRVLLKLPKEFDNSGMEQQFNRKKFYTIRDIPVAEDGPNFYKTSYLGLRWNLQNPDSDKVLNISRDKMIAQARLRLNNVLIEDILPEALPLVLELFEKGYTKFRVSKEEVAIGYFYLEMTCAMFSIKLNHFKDIYTDCLLPLNMASYSDLTAIKLSEFIHAEEMATTTRSNLFYVSEMKSFNERWSQIKNEFHFLSEKTIIVWNEQSFESYLYMNGFKLKEFQYFRFDENNKLLVKMLSKIEFPEQVIKINGYTRNTLLREFFRIDQLKRNTLLGVDPYISIALKNVNYDGFSLGTKQAISNIISPLHTANSLYQMKESITAEMQSANHNLAKEKIKTYLSENLPNRLIEWVKANSVLNLSLNLSDDTILDTYSQVILDYFLIPDDFK